LREKFLKREGLVGLPPEEEESGGLPEEVSSSANARNSDEEEGERGEVLVLLEDGGEEEEEEGMPALLVTCESEAESASARGAENDDDDDDDVEEEEEEEQGTAEGKKGTEGDVDGKVEAVVEVQDVLAGDDEESRTEDICVLLRLSRKTRSVPPRRREKWKASNNTVPHLLHKR
jgi:hypothetical protein